MYARVTVSLIPLDKIDERLKNTRETTLPAAKKTKGYKGYLSLFDRETGERVTVSLWDSEEDMKASEKGYYAEAVKRGQGSGAKRISQKNYVVGIKD